eukprot:m.93952 g.93952  ORF g.93952 m.93952 type:complete len:666 (-) comp26664_c0_seq2:284-2281(-)
MSRMRVFCLQTLVPFVLVMLFSSCCSQENINKEHVDFASCGTSCCGAVFQVALTVDKTIFELIRVLNNNASAMENYTVNDPRDKEFPFIMYDPKIDGLSKGPSGVATLKNSLSKETWEGVDIAVSIINGGATEVRIFSYSGIASLAQDQGRNTDNVRSWWDQFSVQPYQIKPLSTVIGCGKDSPTIESKDITYRAADASSDTSPHSHPTDVLAASGNTVTTTTLAAANADVASCGNACCGLNFVVRGNDVTVKQVVDSYTNTIAVNSSIEFVQLEGAETAGFQLVENTTTNNTIWIAQAVYTPPAQQGEPFNSSFLFGCVINATANETTGGSIAIQGFSLCTDGSGNTRACIYDDGVGYGLQSELFSISMKNVSHSSHVSFGCSTTDANPTVSYQRSYTLDDVMGIFIAVTLMFIVVSWIKVATKRAPYVSTIPTRALYVIYFGMLLHLLDNNGGFGAVDLITRGGNVIKNVPSLNNHPIMMSIAVVLCLTEGIWKGEHAQTRNIQRFVGGMGFIFMSVGLIYVVEYRQRQIKGGMDVAHLTSAHSWIGIIAFALFGFHFLFGLLTMTCNKNVRFNIFYSPFKKVFGYMVYLTSMLAVATGLSQCGYHMAIALDGECLDNSFGTLSCFDREFMIMVLLLWAMVITLFARAQAAEKKPAASGFTET